MATYYVDQTSGLDSNDGLSEGAAWKTIAKVNASTFNAGDIISFKRGETWNERLTVPSSGSAGNYIHFTAYGSGALPKIVATTGRGECVVIHTARDYIKLSFLRLEGGDSATTDALFENDSGENNLIEDCEIDGIDRTLCDACIGVGGGSHLTVRRCTITGARDDGFTMHSGSSATLEECTLSGNTSALNNSSATPMSMTLSDCVFMDNGTGTNDSTGDAIALSNGTFVFNRCHFRGRSDGANFGFYIGTNLETTTFNYCIFDNRSALSAANGALTTPSGGSTTYNNCIFIGGAAGDRGKLDANTGTVVLNNCIFWNWWRLQAFAPGTVTANFCIMFSPTTLSITANNNRIGDNTTDPLFVNTGTGDFHLQGTSPALNAGTDLGIATDFDGVAVGNPPEVGAFEYEIAPAISSHPSSATKNPGESVTFSVVATGVPTPTYQWRKDGVNIGGATSADYTIASVAEGDAGDYDCVVTNSEGSATSNVATLTVNTTTTSNWWITGFRLWRRR